MTLSSTIDISIFGEVLFDCFPDGKRVPGGAPFNVAWHLQALGDTPRFISRVGRDEAGAEIIRLLQGWQLDPTDVQEDPDHPTGRVEVSFRDNEPNYDIVADCAYDFISRGQLDRPLADGILYHGTLSLRNSESRRTLAQLLHPGVKIFLDVNLRAPWWNRDQVRGWLRLAHWVKMNQDELSLLGYRSGGLNRRMAELQNDFQLEQVILTRGEKGTLVRTARGSLHSSAPEPVADIVDTVGAGDAFSAIYLHGLKRGWDIDRILSHAQRFAGQIIRLRGAISESLDFYSEFAAGTLFRDDSRDSS